MKISLQYGVEGLTVDLPSSNVTVIEPRFVPGLPDEERSFHEAVRRPVGSKSLQSLVRSTDRVAVVIPDITRPLPCDRLLAWLCAELGHVPPGNLTFISGTGSHRQNTPAELEAMVGFEIMAMYRVINHDAQDPSTLAEAGRWPDGQPLRMNAEYVKADCRILVGFIEPHLMAGFSGGYKAVFPGIADLDSILRYHSPAILDDSRSTWGILEGNPTQRLIREMGSQLRADFLINVTLNRNREITGYFCGDVIQAHEEGAAFSRSTAMVPVSHRFPVVVTSNSGYPLDQNLYQSVKGMSAAALICMDGGLIVEAARCNDGFPEHGNFRRLLLDHDSPHALMQTLLTPGFSMPDQWEAQVFARVLNRARVALYSELPAEEVRRSHMEPITDVGECVAAELQKLPNGACIAVLPEGPMTIPYIDQ